MAAEAFVLFLDEKTQKSSQPKCFIAVQTPRSKQIKPRATFFCPKFTMALPFCKIPDALFIALSINFICFRPKLFG
jgi:hypothetical protein